MPVLRIERIDILVTKAINHQKRLAFFDLYNHRGYFDEERSAHLDSLRAISAEAQALGYGRDEFDQRVILDVEIYESDRGI